MNNFIRLTELLLQVYTLKYTRMKTVVLVSFLLIALVGYPVWAQNASGGPGNYVVVVGTFSVRENANKFARQVRKQKLNPQLEMDNIKNVHHVYVLETDNHDAAIAEAKRLQKSSPFKDAWVFSRGLIVEPVIATVVEEKPKEEEKKIIIEEPPKEVKAVPVDSAKLREEKIKNEVEKKVMSTKKGDMEKLDFIFFYRDASVLRPESRFAVDKLLQLLREKPKTEIRIHGHTNGNESGKIIKRASDKADFFSLANTVEDYGSAKELSELRANTIRDYLIANGIDKKRMSVKAWGGKKPLVNEDSDKAETNVRVEIEVVQSQE